MRRKTDRYDEHTAALERFRDRWFSLTRLEAFQSLPVVFMLRGTRPVVAIPEAPEDHGKRTRNTSRSWKAKV